MNIKESSAIQIHGGYDYIKEYEVESLERDEKFQRFGKVHTIFRRWICLEGNSPWLKGKSIRIGWPTSVHSLKATKAR